MDFPFLVFAVSGSFCLAIFAEAACFYLFPWNDLISMREEREGKSS
jgi:hypothetical protein